MSLESNLTCKYPREGNFKELTLGGGVHYKTSTNNIQSWKFTKESWTDIEARNKYHKVSLLIHPAHCC